MENKKLYELFDQLAQEQNEATNTDLWPAIKRSIDQKTTRIKEKKTLQWRHTRTLAVIVVILAIFIGFITITPQGKAWAQTILQFFETQEDNTLSMGDPELAPLEEVLPVLATQVTPEVVSCLDSPFPRCSLDEAQQYVDFKIAFPAELPSDFTFDGIKVLDNGVMLAFSAPKGGYTLYQTPFTDEGLVTNPVGDAVEIKSLSVNGQHAEYAEGHWYGTPSDEGAIPWDNNDSVRTLIWVMDGIEFKLVSAGGKVYDSARPSPEQMAAFAESLSTESKPEAEMDHGTSLDEAEKQAGFAIALPSQIPPQIIMTNATYNPAQGVICQHYSDSQGINNDILIVAASPNGLLDPESFGGISEPIGPGGEMFTPTTYVKHVDMPGALNDKAIYLNNGIQLTTLCGEELRTNHGLIWHKGGMSHYVFGYMGGSMGYPFVTYNELLSMAGEISGVDFTGLNSPDPERITSRSDAESVWGEKIAFPSKMVAGMNFDHIEYYKFDDGGKALNAIFTKKPVFEFATLFQSDQKQPDGLSLWGSPNQTVWGYPAIYTNTCWDGDYPGCDATLFWEDDKIHYELYIRTLTFLLPLESLLEIAESMKP